MLLNIILLVVGFVVLIKGADIFVDGASNLARNFKVSKMLVGLTIVAFGTSAPELAVSIKSMISGSGEIVLGNVIGSNILNILLILGCSALVHDLTVKNNTVKKEIPIVLMLTTLLIVLMSDALISGQTNLVDRGDGITLVLFFMVFVYYLISMARHKVVEEEEEEKLYTIPKSILFVVLGIASIVIGSELVVNNAIGIAQVLGVSERIIGLTIIALGTSLPELVTSVMATKKGEYDIAIGNIVGSNIFNIGLVLGIPIAVFGGITIGSFNYIDLAFFFLSALVLFIFAVNDRKIRKFEGIIFLLMFVAYYTLVIVRV